MSPSVTSDRRSTSTATAAALRSIKLRQASTGVAGFAARAAMRSSDATSIGRARPRLQHIGWCSSIAGDGETQCRFQAVTARRHGPDIRASGGTPDDVRLLAHPHGELAWRDTVMAREEPAAHDVGFSSRWSTAGGGAEELPATVPPGRRIVVKRQPSQGTTRGRGVRGGRLRDPPSRIGSRRGESFEGGRRRDWIRQHVAQRDGVGGIGIDRTHRKDAPPAQHRHGCSIRDLRRVDRVGVTPGRHRGADLRRRGAGRGREVTGRGFRRHEHRGLLITWALDRQKQRIDLMTSSRRRQDVYANELGRDPRPHPLHHRGPVGKA